MFEGHEPELPFEDEAHSTSESPPVPVAKQEEKAEDPLSDDFHNNNVASEAADGWDSRDDREGK